MGTAYTAVPGNIGTPGSVTSATAVTATVPADGDVDNAATFDVGLQKLADYIAYIIQANFVSGITNGKGVTGQGQGTGAGVGGTGGATGPGGSFTGGATSGDGVIGTGAAGNSRGGTFAGQGSAAGAQGTGGATGPGFAAIAGGGGSPARGALAMAVQAAPSAPTDGDVWPTVAALFARINGITQQLVATTDTRVAKAWALLTLGTSGAVTVTAGFNVASASYSTSALTVNFTTNLNAGAYAVNALQNGAGSNMLTPSSLNAASVTILQFASTTGVAANYINGQVVHVLIFG